MKHFKIIFYIFIILISACTVSNEKDFFIAPSRELNSIVILDQDSSMMLGRLSSISGVINNAVYIFNPWGEFFYTKFDILKNKAYRFC